MESTVTVRYPDIIVDAESDHNDHYATFCRAVWAIDAHFGDGTRDTAPCAEAMELYKAKYGCSSQDELLALTRSFVTVNE